MPAWVRTFALILSGLIALAGATLVVIGAMPQTITTCSTSFVMSTGEQTSAECTYAKGSPTVFYIMVGAVLIAVALLAFARARAINP